MKSFRTVLDNGLARAAVAGLAVIAGVAIAGDRMHGTTYLSAVPGVRLALPKGSAGPVMPWDLHGVSGKATSTVAEVDSDELGLSRIDGWVTRLTTTLKHDFEKSLGRKALYSSMITAKLDARKMPHDLIYLAMIESEFNPNAKSPMKAVGMWQFMSGTAKRFGLKVGHGVDERKNPAASTDAALAYLSNLHDRFGSWYLAAAAYNSGEGTVLHALQKVTGRSTGTDADFFKILPVLPRETQDYVPKLIASARVGNDPGQYGLEAAKSVVARGRVARGPSSRAH